MLHHWRQVADLRPVGTPLIVGSGPTHYDYRRLNGYDGTIIVVNDAIKVAPDRENVWFVTLHFDQFSNLLRFKPRVLAVLPTAHAFVVGNPVCAYDLHYFNSGNIAFERGKALIANQVYAYENSTTVALCLLFLLGVRNVNLIGCSMLDGSFRAAHDHRLGGVVNPNATACFEMIDSLSRRYGIRARHHGETAECQF